MGVKAGQRLGQYVIIEQIGKGGMATVFRASQPSLSRQVAIKVLPEFFKDDPAFHDRFRQEAMAIARLRHPNVLTVFDSGEADGVAYIVTELVDGGHAVRQTRQAAADRLLPQYRRARGVGARLRARARHDSPRHQAQQHSSGARRHADSF